MKQQPLIKLQRGNVMIMVMMAIITIMLLVSTLINHYVVTEAQAIDESLAKIRIYWAMMGHWNYVASRSLMVLQPRNATTGCPAENCFEHFNYFRASADNLINKDNFVYCQTNNCGGNADHA